MLKVEAQDHEQTTVQDPCEPTEPGEQIDLEALGYGISDVLFPSESRVVIGAKIVRRLGIFEC